MSAMTAPSTTKPWKTGTRHPGRVITGNAVVYCTAPQDEGSETEEEKERAARIAECVNACAGIPDPAAFLNLVRGDYSEALSNLRELVAYWNNGRPVHANAEVANDCLAMIERLEARFAVLNGKG